MNDAKIFISHCANDSKIGEKFLNFLLSLGYKKENIFYSSKYHNGVEIGKNFPNVVRDNFIGANIVVLLLTENFYNSYYCVCEEGAAWISVNKEIVPILLGNLNFGDMKGFIDSSTNYYVNNGVYQGYNIGFNVQELIRSFDVEEDILDSFLVYYGNVLYKKAEQYKFLKNRFKKLEEVHKNDENLNHLTIKLRMFIDSFCAFFKHPKFEEEKEFRIVIEIADARIPRTDNHFVGPYNKKMKYDFYTKNGLIIPCLYVKINKQSFSRITVSPIMEAEITKMSIRELLSTNGYKGCRVYQSTIPIRF